MTDLTKNIKIGVDASGVKTGVQESTNSIQNFGRTVQAESAKVERSTQSMVTSIQRQTAATQAGAKGTAEYYENIAKLRGVSQDALRPYLEDLRKAQEGQDKAAASAKRWADTTKVISNGIAGLAAAFAGGAFFNKFITETINAEQEQAQLAAVLKSTGEAAGWSQEKLNDMASALSKSSMFSAGEINQAQTRLLSYSSVVGQQFPRAMQAVVDMSQRMGMSVTQSAETIGKALDIPSEGLSALTKQGFRFTEQQKLLVEQLEASGQAGKAQGIILDALESSYSGAAAAARDTLGGSLKALQNSFNDVMTGDSGSVKGMRDGIESLNATLSSEATRAGFQTVISGIVAVIEVAVKGISVMGQLANAFSLYSKTADHAGFERQFDFAKGQLDRLQPRLRADPNNLNSELQSEAKSLRDAMDRAHKAMQGVTAQIANQAGVTVPTIDVPKVEAGTKAVQQQSVALGKSSEWIKSFGSATEKANLAIAEWKKKLGDAFTPEMEATIRKSYETKTRGASASESAAKKEMTAYNSLVASIQTKIAQNQKEIDGQDKLTASQQEEIKLNEDLKSGKLKLTAAHEADIRARIAIAAAQEKAIETSKNEAAITEQLRQIRMGMVGELEKSAQAYMDGNKGLEEEIAMIGKNATERTRLTQARNQEIILIKKATLAELERQSAITGTQSRAEIALQAEIEQLERRNELLSLKDVNEQADANLKQLHDQFTQTVQQVEDIFVQGFADMMNNGKSGWESFCKSLKTSFFTLVAKEIYAMFAKPFVVQLVGSFMGMLGGGGGLLGGLLGGGGASGGGGVMGLLSNGSSAYSLYSGEGLLGQGSRYVAGMFGYGAAPWTAAGVQASGAVTMPVGGSLGAAAPGSGGMGAYAGVGYAAAIVMAAAYLGGMFKEEKQVGSGLTGELGGDLYGYQLMRESGGLFDGPDYRYVVAEKEIEKSKAEIERLKKEIADNPNDARNGYRERQLQQQYSRLEMLSQYDGAIEASKGPIKILQDAFTAMREDTAARADSLKLDGDSIRAMKVTLGLDEIHPDTGGKGLELTGLSQEEAAAKIQAALAQANEEMARSVLGTWQEQTREVSRMVWDNVELPSDGDTQQYGRVGREVTETITEQVFVMSEYVRAGETAVQALTRLSDSLLSVNTVFDMLGVTLMDTSLAGADLASDIIDAFGGGDKFSAATGNYYDKFYSDQEKAQNQARLLNEQLKKLGVETMPASREALREYINGIDLSSEEGRKLYASLLGLVDVFDLIYTSAENIASLKQDLNVQLLRAQGNDAEALRLEREKQIKELEKYNDPELVRMQRDVWAAEDKTKADEEAKQAAETAKALGMKNLEAAISREKEYWNQFSADAKDSLTKASSYFDLVTNAAKSLRDSVEDSASWSAAAGMVYIEQALDRARKGGGLSDLDGTKSAIEAATGGLVMDNYATQAELDYDKKVLAGQLDELGGYAELAKSDAQKQIDLATSQIKRLDDTLTFWKEYGEEQVDATLSVTDAVNALYKLLDPKEQERIRKEEAEKAGLGGGAATPGKAGSGAALGGTVSGTAGRYVVGFTADGRAKWSDGTVETFAAGQSQYEGHLQVGSGNLTAEQWAAMQAGQNVYGTGWEFDEKQGLWMRRKSFAVGTNYVPYDMTANIHQGERIIPAADNRALMAALGTQGGGNAELVQEVKALRAELQAINSNTAAGAEYGRRTSSDISQVTEGGNAMRVANMA